MNEWINVKDRLPEYNDDVLVIDNGDIYIAHLSKQWDMLPDFYCHAGRIKYVTHWMPLPEVPHD